jgi:hypothetical protein
VCCSINQGREREQRYVQRDKERENKKRKRTEGDENRKIKKFREALSSREREPGEVHIHVL